MSAEGPVSPLAFDELAMAEDLVRLGQGGVEALEALGRELDRLGGLPRDRLIAWPATDDLLRPAPGRSFAFKELRQLPEDGSASR